jgi:hypothetical protein
MTGRRKVQRYEAAQEPQRPPLDFAQGSLLYTRQARRRRNRRYRLIAGLVILGVVIGIAAALLPNWLIK